MEATSGPAVTRRRLQAELRRLREEHELSLDEVATQMVWSVSKLVRIENGSVGITVNDLKMLLDLYEVKGQQVDQLVDMARRAKQRESKQKAWWTQYRAHLSPSFTKFIRYEAEASQLWLFQPLVVPGLLQTEAYARAVITGVSAGETTSEDVDVRVQIRLARRAHTLDGDDPPELVVVIEEAVLHRLVGDETVMRDQLDYLIECNKRDHVSVVVLPFTAGASPGLSGVFSLIQFGDEAASDVLFVENAAEDIIVTDRPEQTAARKRAFERFLEIGLRDADANDMIREARNRFQHRRRRA